MNEEEMQMTLNDLHKSFATLTQADQKYANIFLHDIQSGNITLETGKTFRDYITEYQHSAKANQINQISDILGLYKAKLQTIMNSGVAESNINEYGRFDDLKNSVNKAKAKSYFEKLEGSTISPFKVSMKTSDLLKRFIVSDGLELEQLNDENKH